MSITKPAWIILVLLAFAAAGVGARAESPQSQPCSPWPATDALGRKLPLSEEVGPPRGDRFVGIFYFLWHNQRESVGRAGGGPYDVSKILAQDTDALEKPESPLWGPLGMFHYWGEPVYGYYLSTDPWVLRRHANLLADAGIDTLIFDTTNAVTYPDVYRKLCEVFTQVREEGGRTPQIAFMVNTEAGKTAQRIYEDLYKPGHFRDLWFFWQGKPLLICDPKQAGPELQGFFTLRRAHWPFTIENTPYAWHWETAYPQVYGYTDDPNKPEQVNAAVAQNLRITDGLPTNMSEGNARGRSFHNGQQDATPGAGLHGHNFREQLDRACELTAPFMMITGWNEWIAGRFGQPKGPIIFVDQFSQEYSRDIEPMKGGHGDNYYWQMAAGVRRYKGAPPLPSASAAKTIHIEGVFDQWQDVDPEFRDHLNETLPRDFAGTAGLEYVNRTGRNDLAVAKVARDAKNVYFYVRAGEPLSPATDANWMWLLLDVDQNSSTGWEGCDYIVNRTVEKDGTTWLERNEGDWNWSKVAKVSYRIRGSEMHLAIPRAALGLPEGQDAATVDFQWADNLQSLGDRMDFYTSGDVAPEGRFRYRYLAK